MKNLKNKLADFNTSLTKMRADEAAGKRIKQNHFGDYLMIEQSEDKEHYRVWLNNPENVAQGVPQWQIEYCGSQNKWVWKTIAQGKTTERRKI